SEIGIHLDHGIPVTTGMSIGRAWCVWWGDNITPHFGALIAFLGLFGIYGLWRHERGIGNAAFVLWMYSIGGVVLTIVEIMSALVLVYGPKIPYQRLAGMGGVIHTLSWELFVNPIATTLPAWVVFVHMIRSRGKREYTTTA
ncbi:MAG: hypothetical protein V3T70_02450, partial [Phycisphaerae bacterium]